jgi:hypothetical protein
MRPQVFFLAGGGEVRVVYVPARRSVAGHFSSAREPPPSMIARASARSKAKTETHDESSLTTYLRRVSQ